MAMKMYNKSNLTFNGSFIIAPNREIVAVDPSIVAQANQLETLKQKAEYLAAQPEATPMPTLDGFKRKSVRDSALSEFEVKTPIIDMKIAEGVALMDEIDDMQTAEVANRMLADYIELLEFVDSDYVIDHNSDHVMRFDTPTLGNVLELTKQDIVDTVATLCGLERVENEDYEYTAGLYDKMHILTDEESQQLTELPDMIAARDEAETDAEDNQD